MKSYVNIVVFYLTAVVPFFVSALPQSYQSNHQAILPISLSWTVAKGPLAITQLKYMTQSVKAIQKEVDSISHQNDQTTVPVCFLICTQFPTIGFPLTFDYRICYRVFKA